MPPGDGWTSRLLAGIAQRLEDEDIGVWRTSGIYTSGEVGIIIRAVPQSPEQIITLAAYPIGTNLPGLADHRTAVQIRVRGTQDPRVCDDRADAIFDVLDGLANVLLGDIAVVLMWRQSYTSLGQDNNNRWERSENYYLDTMRPTGLNTD